MFRKAEWFRPKSFGWGIYPITLPGWVYALVCAFVLLIPFLSATLAGNWFWGSLVFTVLMVLMIKDVKLILDEIELSDSARLEQSELNI